ncbi:MAG: excinuclease ABC subunit UvrC, partial [Nitrosotalea sp.]
KDQTAHLMSFRLSNGVIKDRNKFSFDLVGDNTFSSFLSQYYSTNTIPRYVITSEIPDKKEILEEVFARSAGFTVRIMVPTTGKRREIIDLIMKNISLAITKGADPALVELQEKLGLQNIPRTIECFDISNHGEDYAVGSMSCMVDGKPHTSGYRKFKIKTVHGRDDFAMINEIVKRRYLRLKEEKSKMPDLILIDGGRGQLNAALDALHTIGVDIPCISLAKENEEVYQPLVNKPLVMAKTNPALKVLQHARDEAHRFGVAYNRAIRKFT